MSEIVFSLIVSKDKFEKSSQLVRKEYLKEGYIDKAERSKKNPVSHGNLLPVSVTFQAGIGETLLATISIVTDGARGMPMEAIYKEEVNALRNKNRKIAEISQLAINREHMEGIGKNKIKAQSLVLLSLFRVVFYYAHFHDIDTLCIAINPKHEGFYDSLGFQSIGTLKYYSSVNNAPALAKAFFMDEGALQNTPDNLVLREILKNPLEKEAFEGSGDRILFTIDI